MQPDTETLSKINDRVKYRGEWNNCENFHTKDNYRNWCNCPFVACTGSRECTTMSGFFCRFFAQKCEFRRYDKK